MELFKGRSATRTAEVKEHKLYLHSWRATLRGYNTFSKKWKIIENKTFKSLGAANKYAEEWITAGNEHDSLLKKYGKDPMTYN